jgi:hypothetical protein
MAVHFIGFTDTAQFHRAVEVFGKPDFIHRQWDVRAQQEVVQNDIAVFARGNEKQNPTPYSFDDSQHF